MIIRKNPDEDYVREIRKRLKDNSGYCISRCEKTPETKCMCKDFLEQEDGVCYCGLYIKYKD